MLKMLLRGRVVSGSLCQLFSLICISFCFLYLKAGAAGVIEHRLGCDVSATAVFQNEHPVTLTGNGIPLRAVFKAIKKQTGYAVMYSTSATSLNQDEKVTVDFKETPLDDVLGVLFKGRNLEWQYSDDILLIRKREVFVPKKSDMDSTVTPVSLMGKVTDASGQSLPGVTVQVKGRSSGTTTDADGRFSLPKVAVGETLVISSVGFRTSEIVVKGKNILAQLTMDVSNLDETVIIAYGTTTKRLTTGNISTIKSEEIQKQPINNPLLALQGRVAGLVITQSTGFSGSGVSVQIQGQNSISSNVGNDPLYVIDGVPYTSRLLWTLSRIQGSSGNNGPSDLTGLIAGAGNPLSFINPADIESIDILKDADATSIYGSRAANGAILITTKKGKSGQIKVDVNMQHGWSKVPHKLELLNTQQYLMMRHEAKRNDQATVGMTDYDINGTWDSTSFTDWQQELIGRTAHYTDAQASVSGGNATTQFLVGTGYHKETTVFPGNFGDRKGSLHFSLNNTTSNQKFKFQLSGNYLVDNNKLINIDPTAAAIVLAPVSPRPYDINGNLNWAPDANGSSTWLNPMASLLNKYTQKTYNLISNAMISYQVLPNFDIKSSFGYTNLQSNETLIQPLTSIPPSYRAFFVRSSSFSSSNINSWIIEPQANYKSNLGKGFLEILAGATIQQNNSNREQQTGTGYNSDLALENISAAPSIRASRTGSTYKYGALFGKINYNWTDKYIANFTMRRDGSSRFGTKNQFHNFYSIAGAWIFSNERPIKNNFRILSFGKIRGSYGTTGNDQIGDYLHLSLYNNTNVPLAYQGASGIKPQNLSNPYLQWEETRKLQFGLDLGFFKDRIILNSNYYHNKSSNQLVSYALPVMTGFTEITKNFQAIVKNYGWEFTLSTINLMTPKFRWSSNINMTIPKNKLVSFPNLNTSSYSYRLVIGEPITILKNLHLIGVDPSTGTYQFSDSHGSPTSTPDLATDANTIINPSPKFYGGFINSFSYKGFELSFLFQFVKQLGLTNSFGYLPGDINNQPISVLKRWQKPGDISPIQRFNSNFSIATQFNYAGYISDASWPDASYIKLKNLSLYWQLPDAWRKKINLQNGRLFLQGQNLFTITHYKGLDPETRSLNTLPPLRVLTLGAQFTL